MSGVSEEDLIRRARALGLTDAEINHAIAQGEYLARSVPAMSTESADMFLNSLESLKNWDGPSITIDSIAE